MSMSVLREKVKVNQAIGSLTDQIQDFDQKALVCKTQAAILRFAVEIESADLIAWLQRQDHFPKFFWADREGQEEVACAGAAHVLTGKGRMNHQFIFDEMQRRLSPDQEHLRYYGGMCFDFQNSDENWKDFGSHYFFIPRFELIKQKKQFIFACNITREEFNQGLLNKVLADLRKIDFSSHVLPARLPKIQKREDYPSDKKWQNIISEELAAITKNDYKKIVLARKSSFRMSAPLEAADILRNLQKVSPHCFYFYLQPKAGAAFVGASPERLYKREGQTIQTEALAGTRPRGSNPQADEKLKKELLNSTKEVHEHQLVVEQIRHVLAELCKDLTIDPKHSLLQLEGGQHLLTRIKGVLLPPVDDARILFVLHPTPAVAGWPTEKILDIIKSREPFARGYYAGPLGYIGWDAAEFAVAIRSGLIQKNTLAVYAGAGIVQGSTAKAEWNEIENKMQIFLKAIEL